jgi:hypothetical protein
VVAAVQHSPRDVTRPDVDQRLEDDSKVSATVAAEKSGDVLGDGDVWLAVARPKFANNSNCFMEESAPRAIEARTFAGHREVLAWKAVGDDVDRREVVRSDLRHVVVQIGLGESQSEDGLRLVVNLNGPRRLKARPTEAEVKPSDASEQRADAKLAVGHCSPLAAASAIVCAASSVGA